MKLFTWTSALLGITTAFAAIGDKIDIDGSTTTVNGVAITEISANNAVNEADGTWKIFARTGTPGTLETLMHNGNLVSTKNNSDALIVSIPAQAGLARYELRLHGKKKDYDMVYTVAIDGNTAQTVTAPGTDDTNDPAYYSSVVVNGNAHTIALADAGTINTKFLLFDYFEVVEIPAPIVQYTADVTDAVAQNFAGKVGSVAISNESSLLGDDATITLEGDDKDHFSLSTGNLNFTVPANPKSSYTVTVKVDHMGESSTEDVTVNVQTENGGGVSLNAIPGLTNQGKYKVYDLQGNLIKTLPSLENWKSNLSTGLYMVSYQNRNSVEFVR